MEYVRRRRPVCLLEPTSDWLGKAIRLGQAGRTNGSIRLIIHSMNRLMWLQRFGEIGCILESLEVDQCDVYVLCSLESCLRWARSKIPNCSEFVRRAAESLERRGCIIRIIDIRGS